MSSIYEGIPLQQLSVEPMATHPKETKERVLNLLIRSSKKEPSGMGRSVALSCLGIFLYNELTNRSNHPRLGEVTAVLVSATKVSNLLACRSQLFILFCFTTSPLFCMTLCT